MANDNKAVGPLATAKLVALIKSALNGKLDKTGGTIFGDLKVKKNAEGTGNIDVDGEIRVNSGTAHLRDVHATGTVHSDLMAEAPLLNLRAPLAEKSVKVTQDGDTAVKMECFDGTLSKGYARLEIGTPTGDNDAATKAYVDSKVKKDFVVNITFNTAAPPSIIDDRKIAVFSAATDKSFAEISSAVAAGKNVYGVRDGEKWPLYLSSSTEHAFRGSVQLDRVFGSVGLAIANCIVMQNVCTVEVSAGELPAPALNGSDNGKVPTVNGSKWELKAPAVKEDFVVTITPLSPSDVPTSVDGGIAQFTAACDKTFAEIKGAIDAGKNVLGNYGGNIWPLSRATDTMIAIDGTINLGYFGDTSNATCTFVIQSNGIATITCAAGELPAVSNKVFNKVLVANNGHWDLTDTLPSPNSDGSDNGKVPTVNGTRWEMKKPVVDDALSDTSTNPVQNKVVKAALDGKASTEVASQTANGLMSAKDKTKLDGIEDGATRVIVDDSMSGTSTNPVQNKVVKKYIDDHNFLPDPIPNGNAVQTLIVDRASRGYKLMTFDNLELPGAAESTNAPQTRSVKYLLDRKASKDAATEESDGLMSAIDKTKLDGIEDYANKTVVDEALDSDSTNPVQNKAVKTALDGKAGTAVASASANGLMSKDDKKKLDGIEDGATRVIVDDAMSDTSTNPVQNKAVKAALDGKLDKTGGTLTGNLRVTGALFSGDGLSFGTGENIHFTKAADDAGKLAHGAAGVDDTVPLARLKVASPTEDDDAATKAYVDNNAAGAGAVRYDAAQTLDLAQQGQARTNIGAVGHNSPQFHGFLTLAPADAPIGTGVGLTPSMYGNEFTLDISDVNEGTPTELTGVKTPSGKDPNAAATVEYVLGKALPAVTTEDNGKILKVVNGAWQAVFPD